MKYVLCVCLLALLPCGAIQAEELIAVPAEQQRTLSDLQLWWALDEGDEDRVVRLLSMGANPNMRRQGLDSVDAGGTQGASEGR